MGIRIPLAAGLLAVAAHAPAQSPRTPIAVSSIAELRAHMGASDAVITMAPGSYWMPRNGASNAFLDFSGSNTEVVFDGVHIRVDTRDLAGFGQGHQNAAKLLRVSGDGIELRGLTLTSQVVGTEGWADMYTDSVEILGSDVVLRDFRITTRGSNPYGFGDAFGKGGNPGPTRPFISHSKHSGIRVGNGASGVLLEDIELHMRSYGHGIYFQEGANDIVVRRCLVSGDEMAWSDDIIANPLYQAFGFATYGEMIPAGIRISKHEDGIRSYGPANGFGHTHDIRIEDTVVERMRDAYALGDSGGTIEIVNSESWECEMGFTPGNPVSTGGFDPPTPIANRIIDCRGDARNGPLLFFRRSGSNVEAEVDLAGDEPPTGIWPVALVSGSNHTITLTRSAPEGLYPPEAFVNASQYWRTWRHRPAEDIDATVPRNTAATTTGSSIANLTGQLLVLGAGATGNTATSNGGVLNKGANNTYTGTTLIPAPIIVEDTWGAHTVWSGIHQANNTLSLGGTNAVDDGTLVEDGGALFIASNLQILGEPIVLHGDGDGRGALFSVGASGTGTRVNHDGSAPIEIPVAASIGVTGGNQNLLVGPISGGGSLAKVGAGTLVMEGVGNTLAGTITIAEGRVRVRTGKIRNNLAIAPGAVLGVQGQLGINQAAEAGALVRGTIDLNDRGAADPEQFIARIGRLNGTATGLVTSTSTALQTLRLLSEEGSSTYNGSISGTVRLVKQGEGRQALGGASSHTGGTEVLAGTLAVDGSIPGPVLVAGGVLAGMGTIGGPVEVATGGTIAPGPGIGVLATGPQSWKAGGALRIEVADAAGAAGSGWGLLAIDGALALDAGLSQSAPFRIVVEPSGAASGFGDSPAALRIVSASGITGMFDPAAFEVDASAFFAANGALGGAFRVEADAGGLLLVHEPGTAPPTMMMIY